jgi:hypothetical protein
MFELGQALNAEQSPSIDITSDPTDNVSSESGRWIEYLMMTRLNGSQINSPSGRVGTDGGRFKSSGLTVEVQDEWIAMMRRQEPAIVSPKSG